MRIVFMGTPEFAVPSLKVLADAGHDIAAVVTSPDRPAGRGLKVQSSAVKQFAQSQSLTIIQPESLKDDNLHQQLRALNADLFVVVAFRILPQEVIDIPKMGAINLHASLLPQYRGAAPINWAIIKGEQETGVTTFYLKQRVDTGDILLQRSTPIGSDETAGELHDRLKVMGAEAIVDTVKGIEDGKIVATPQLSEAAIPKELNVAPKIFPADCELQPHISVTEAHNFIRGLSPHPGAWTMWNGMRLKVLRSVRHEGSVATRSTPLFVDAQKLWLSCSNGCLELTELQLEGKRRMSGEELARGWR